MIMNEDDVLVHIIAPAQSKYTEVSDGRGNYGILLKIQKFRYIIEL